LSSTIQKQLEEIKELIRQDKLQKSLKLINNILKDKKLEKEEKLATLNVKGEILFYLGEDEEASEVIDGVIDSLTNKEPFIAYLDAINCKLATNTAQTKFDDHPTLIREGENLLKKIKNISEKKIAKYKSQLKFFKLQQIALVEKDYGKLMEIAQEALKHAEMSEDKSTIIWAQAYMGLPFIYLGKLDEAVKNFDKLVEIAKKHGNKMDNLLASYHNASKYFFLGELKEALKVLLDLEIQAKKIGTKRWLVEAYLDCATIYQRLFDYDKALIYLQKAEELGGFRKKREGFFLNFGQLYQIKGEFELAIEYYLKALEWQKTVSPWLIPDILYNLIILSLELNRPQQAKDYLEELKKLNQELDKKYEKLVLYSEASIYKASSRMRDWTKANDILDQLLEMDDLDLSFQILITLDQSELLLKELQLSGDEDLWEEITINITRLYDIAQENQYVVLLIEIYRLQSQLELVNLNPKKSISLLDQAYILAKEKGLLKLANEIEITHQEIKKRLGFWEELSKEKIPIDERLKHVPLINSVQRVSHEAVVEERDEKTGEIIEYRKLFALKL
jgi:tetratricopeptide (TPR) repeat protein